jgi:hypothetical protein
MNRVRLPGILLLCLLVVWKANGAEEDGGKRETVPEGVRRPQHGEALRYPQDTVIGPLGRGEAPEGAYRFARDFLNRLLSQNPDSPAFKALEENLRSYLIDALEPVAPRRVRIGGGREEPGGASFLVRFLGPEQWAAGELYLHLQGDQWRVDDLVLEEPRQVSDSGETYRFDFSPYERFY